MVNNIVFISDDNYVMPTCVAIYSLIKNLRIRNEYVYNIYVLTYGINSDNIKKIESYSTEYVSVSVKTVDVKKYENRMKKINQRTHVTPTALLKFELCNIFPDISKILYLDSDIVINNDISDLFDIDISKKLMAGSFEYWKYLISLYDSTKRQNVDFYFNSGVMLLNLDLFREKNLPEMLWKTKIDNYNGENNKSGLMDQDVFNDVCGKSCIHLDIKYNCNCKFIKKVDIDSVNSIYQTSYKDVKELKDAAVIIHYVGKEDKPWKYSNAPLQDIWLYYYKLAGFDTNTLKLEKYGTGIGYYIERLKVSIKKRGIIKTIRYIFIK